ncbi:hypothetical protein [Paenibacillus rigui]|uniref:LysM domain-containing protein n=1 Tax=Paenibacillus rigui TaxID=554312 RepID=A0A229UT98_9BACL|nr:hypothetical protein [Paenibacillus rigui]OXM86491.1 hypothetical protein CF651_09970 [Paenibacillus rigui]
MRSMQRKMWAGTVAVALLLGGFGGLTTPQAYADEDEDTTVIAPAPADTSIPLNKRFHLDWSQVEGNASNILGMDWIDLNDALTSGKSIAEVAASKGVSGEGLVSQLVQLEASQVNEALQANKITQDEADRLNKQITDKITKIVNKEGYQYKAKEAGQHNKSLQLTFKPKAAELAELLKLDKEQVKQQLAEGKSVADIAAAQGITEDELITKLTEQIKPALKSWIHQTEQQTKK